jgi:predicted ATP-dependent protease
VEFSSRIVENQHKLSTRFNKIAEILYEADFWAQEDDEDIVMGQHVQKAIDKKVYRSNRYEEKLYGMFNDKDILIDVEGEKVGQINGLAVLGTGEHSFGKQIE